MAGVLVRRGEKTEGPGPATVEAEIGELQPQAEEHRCYQQTPAAGSGRKGLPRAVRESDPWVLDFWSHFCVIGNVCCFTSPTLPQQPPEIIVYVYHPFINPKEVSLALNVDEKAHT